MRSLIFMLGSEGARRYERRLGIGSTSTLHNSRRRVPCTPSWIVLYIISQSMCTWRSSRQWAMKISNVSYDSIIPIKRYRQAESEACYTDALTRSYISRSSPHTRVHTELSSSVGRALVCSAQGDGFDTRPRTPPVLGRQTFLIRAAHIKEQHKSSSSHHHAHMSFRCALQTTKLLWKFSTKSRTPAEDWLLSLLRFLS